MLNPKETLHRVQDLGTTLYNSKPVMTAVEVSKSPIFFMFPEAVVNPTRHAWYPWLCFLIRVWLYSLALHHIAELKGIMDLIPFISGKSP